MPQAKPRLAAASTEDFLAEAGAMLVHQLSRQRYDNLAAIGSAHLAKHFFGDAFTDAPVEQRQPHIVRAGDSSTLPR